MSKSLFSSDLLFILEYQEPVGYDGAFSVWRRLGQEIYRTYDQAKAAKDIKEMGADYGSYEIYPIVPFGSCSLTLQEQLQRDRAAHVAARYQIHYRNHQHRYRFWGHVPDVENLEP
ncbi:MAG: hypothetical protein Kow00121_30380 [Elainellaceae cyanobacterium]